MESTASHPGPADEPRRVTPVHVGDHWTLELEPGFRRRLDGGDLVLWKRQRTVYATVFAAGSAEAEEAIVRMLADRRDQVRQQFDRIEPGLVGHAYLLPERRGGNRYWGLNAWVNADRSVLCITFYFPELSDLPWALAAWHSVRSGDSPQPKYAN